jgi:hypothetical protein
MMRDMEVGVCGGQSYDCGGIYRKSLFGFIQVETVETVETVESFYENRPVT